MASSIDVSVEALQECLVQEITYDGQEIYVLPLSMSENLTKMAHKIDFSKIENEEFSPGISEVVDDDETDQDNEQQPTTQPPMWPWESIRNKLRNALTEVCVLHDILAIAKDKRYMMLDYVEHDVTDTRNGLLLVARKRAMSTAASILNTGLDRMRRNLDAVLKNKSQDFHYEMLKLRKLFKLKKSGTKIFGDLSYKSSGSQYIMSGTFEVIKADNEGVDGDSSTPYTALGPPQQSPTTSNLGVIIPEELSGYAYIRVFLKSLTEQEFNFGIFFSQNFSASFVSPSKYPANLPWMKKLEMAQQVIFCKETFSKLVFEAHSGLKSKYPNISCGNQLVCQILPKTNLFITLVHHKGSQRNKTNGKIMPANNLFFQEPQDQVLEHCLYQLLRESHLRNANLPMPHPVSGQLRNFRTEHVVGSAGYSKSQIDDIRGSLAHVTMLESLVKVAQLQCMRQRVADLLDQIVLQVQEPLIYVYAISNPCVAKVIFKIGIAFSGFDLIKTSFAIYVTHNSIEIACKDGQYVFVSQGLNELKDFVMRQVAENHIAVVHALARQFNWKVVSTHKQAIMSKKDESLETGTGIIIVSPHHNRQISVCCSQCGYQRVMILRMTSIKDKIDIQNTGISDRWKAALEGFELVNMRRVPGVHFALKIENLIALLSYHHFGKI